MVLTFNHQPTCLFDLFSFSESELSKTKVHRLVLGSLSLGCRDALLGFSALAPASLSCWLVSRCKRTRASGRTLFTCFPLLFEGVPDPPLPNAASKASTLVFTDVGLKGLFKKKMV